MSILTSFAQKLHSIKFVYFGNETKPVGTLIISVEKLIKPSKDRIDTMFGRGIKTDINTFMTIRNMAQQIKAKYSAPDPNVGYYNHHGYIVKDSDGSTYGLEDKNVGKFFDDLRAILKVKKEDEAVIEVLKYKY